MPIQPRTYSSTNPPPSRLESSLLKYSPGQYSRFLQSNNSAMNGVSSNVHPPESDPVMGPVQTERDEVDSEPETNTTQNKQQFTSSTSSSRPRSRLQAYSPFMKLMGNTLRDNP
ncbi:hypothetical protein CRENBAI_024858 [Crenichthys baileyi]|uniref:Uncharacterized protein n=1 Tax=Crenichthys baileyi TaxID=28760 RepID=A0AAV9RPH1_9TELE